MARQVKCQITKECGTSDDFYKAPNGKYYKTKNIYDEWKLQTDKRIECIDVIMELLGYKKGMKLPTIAFKKIGEYEVYGYDVLFDTIREQIDKIQWALNNKDFKNETGRISYVFAILQNNVMTVYKKKEAEKHEMKINSRIDVTYEDIDIQRSKQEIKDIRKWLED